MEHPISIWDCKAAIEIVKDSHGIDRLTLCNPQGASATVSLNGGQVLSWKNEHGEELLFSSKKGTPKRQIFTRGILICFPQFSTCTSLESHGFTRNDLMRIDPNPPPPYPSESIGDSSVNLLLKPSNDDLKRWPYSFEFRMRVTLSAEGNLILTSKICNGNCKPFSFSFVYHTHFSVSDISEVRIEGLETIDYLDNLRERERFTEHGDALTLESEVDRVYVGCPNTIAVIDHERKRTYVIRKEGLPDAVVWNPWGKTKAMPDFGDEDYKKMVCVDAAVLQKPVTLRPGEEWTGRLCLSVETSTFCHENYDLDVSHHNVGPWISCLTWLRSFKPWVTWFRST